MLTVFFLVSIGFNLVPDTFPDGICPCPAKLSVWAKKIGGGMENMESGMLATGTGDKVASFLMTEESESHLGGLKLRVSSRF